MMTRRSPLRAALGVLGGMLCPLAARAEDRSIQFAVSMRSHDDRPLPDEPLRVVLGTTVDHRDRRAGLALRTDGSGRATWSGVLPRETRLKRYPTNFADTLLGMPQRVDWLQVAVELPFMGSPCLYVTEFDWFAAQRTSMQSTASAWWMDEQDYFTCGAESEGQPERGGGWRLPLAAWRHLVFTHLGHTLRGSLKPPSPDAAGAPWRLDVAIRRDPPPVLR